ncbi:MAG: NifB/NifX family molybdenum-iron cluster-binding protein [Candidatus Diapherotrites archaeon]|nr:NifB/NifX family molybdenum-iron cluster-binding protein [Candidatus Diapherotrites archaeon]
MKVAISANSADLNSLVSPVFGRCAGFIIAEVENGEIKSSEFVANPALNMFRGAGIQAAQLVLSKNVQAVISGNLGPNAFAVLQQAGIKIYQAFGLSIKDAVKKLCAGTLPEMTQVFRPGFGRGFGRGRGFGMRGRGFGYGFGGAPY